MKLTLSSALLFALLTPLIMTYRISPGDTPYWLFGLIFLGIAVFVILDVLNVREGLKHKLKLVLISLLIVFTLGATVFSEALVRHKTSPLYNIHDIILQQEAAIRLLLDGKNPYKETYFGTPLEEWHYSESETNPALFHFVMQPMYLYFALPFYFVSNLLLGFFDARLPLMFLFFASLIFAYLLPEEKEKKLLFVTILAFNPAMSGYLIEGRSDFFVFGFFIASVFALYKKMYFFSVASLALAFGVKQSIWPIFPIYFTYLFTQLDRSKVVKYLVVFCVLFLLIILPFVVWDFKAFLDSTVFYLSGNTPNSYPVSGYGFGMLLHEFGIIKDLHDKFPFAIFQMIFGLPILIFLVKFVFQQKSIRSMVFAYGLFLFIFWYFSRYFNNSHVGFLTTIFITAYFLEDSNSLQKRSSKLK